MATSELVPAARTVIDVHGHLTTLGTLRDYRAAQVAAWKGNDRAGALIAFSCSDDEIREAVVDTQIRSQRERGIAHTLLSPTAGEMGHHIGSPELSVHWSRVANDVIHRVVQLFPANFSGVCQLPQSAGGPVSDLVRELQRCVVELGFVGCNLNPDPSGGYWQGPPLHDRFYYPLYETMCELSVPAMVHVSGSCNPAVNMAGGHYMAGDTIAFMQLLESQLFSDFPALKFVIPHGGGAALFQWGRYRALALRLGKGDLMDHIGSNVFFDTCVYSYPGIEMIVKTMHAENILFASEAFGAANLLDPQTGHWFDDTLRYFSALDIGEADMQKILCDNALDVYPRLRLGAFRAAER